MHQRRLTFTILDLLCIIGTLLFVSSSLQVTALIREQKSDNQGANPVTPEKQPRADFLFFKLNYIYQSGGKGEFKSLVADGTLFSGDHYKIIFTPSQDCYVYIFQIDSSNKIYSLFPMEEFGGVQVQNRNPVQGGHDYYLPAKTKSFVLDHNTGTEKIYFLASQERDLELETQYQQAFEAQQHQELQQQLREIDALLNYAQEMNGVAQVSPEPDATTSVTWQEDGQTFSVLQQRLENMCDGCVQVLTFTHQ